VVNSIVAEAVVIGATFTRVISGGVASTITELAAVVKECPHEFAVFI